MSELTQAHKDLQRRAYEAGLEFRPLVAQWDRANQVPYKEIAQRLGELGFFGLCMPVEYGGKGGSALEYLIANAAIFRGAQFWVVGEPLFATSGPGPSMILLADNEAVRRKYLPDLVAGRVGCAIALTEPAHGSDLTHLETQAVLDGDEWVLNGEKSYITGAVENELYAVFARFDGIPGGRGIGAIVVERGTTGFTMDRGPEFLGARGLPHGNLWFKNARVPKENLIRGPGHFAQLMTAFNIERLHNTAFNLGMAEAAFDEASAHVRKRHVFGRPVIEFQATYHALADIYVQIEAHRALALHAATTAIDGRFPKALEVSVAKIFGATILPQITLKALELVGGVGVTMDSALQRIHRDVITAVAAGGSPPVLRNTIAGQIFPDLKFSQAR
jgi:alkylation response protein AidB-like acyl-CoA dehydrogenase